MVNLACRPEKGAEIGARFQTQLSRCQGPRRTWRREIKLGEEFGSKGSCTQGSGSLGNFQDGQPLTFLGLSLCTLASGTAISPVKRPCSLIGLLIYAVVTLPEGM